ncbi:unnamed protein product [Symbiodinium microadriaticum]|nr:unnamed protein product [Symbiodinium microadriaticum]
MAANEASLQCKVHALQAEKEEAQDVIAMRDTEIAELKQTNGQLDSWNWEWHRQHESLATMQTMQTDQRKQMDAMSEEIKAMVNLQMRGYQKELEHIAKQQGSPRPQ